VRAILLLHTHTQTKSNMKIKLEKGRTPLPTSENHGKTRFDFQEWLPFYCFIMKYTVNASIIK